MYTSSGHVLYVRQGTLFAQRFDPVRLALAGNPVSVAEQVAVDGASSNLAAASASVSGPIVYRTGAGSGQRQFVWFDRSGKEIAKLGDPDSANALSSSAALTNSPTLSMQATQAGLILDRRRPASDVVSHQTRAVLHDA